MESNRFRINTGECIIEDDKLIIDISISGTVRRIYEGSKIFFFIIVSILIWEIISIIFDIWIFSREVALWTLALGGGISVIISIFWIWSLNTGNLTRDTVIPLSSIQYVDCSESGLFPRIIIKYQKDGSNVSRFLQFPYSWFSYTHKEYEKAKRLFENEDVNVDES